MARYVKLSKGKIILCLVLVLVIIALTVTYANLRNAPGWNDIGAAGNSYSECISFLDVGQGDSALLKSGGRNAVIDVGTPEGAKALCNKIASYNVKQIDLLMFSHNHDDHIGGGEAIAAEYKILNLIFPDLSRTTSPTRIIKSVTESVDAYGGKIYTARLGAYFSVGGIKVTVLFQNSDTTDENDRSVVAMAVFNGNKFLFTGDAGKSVEKMMLSENIDVDCDVLKVGHHGSSGSSTDEFLAATSPDYAVISCGEGNSYKHPHEAALARIEKTGAEIYRTDINGDITFYIKNGELAVTTQK